MVMFFVLGFVLLTAIVVIGGLFVLMKKEAEKGPDKDAVLITDISELKRQISPDEKKPAGAPADELSEAKAKLAALEQSAPVAGPPPAVPGEIKFSKIITDDELGLSPASAAGSDQQILEQRVRDLEAEIQAISEKAVRQAEEAVRVIEALSQENDALKAGGLVASSAPDGDLNALILELKEKNSILGNQLDLGTSKVEQLETQLAVIRKEMGQQLLEANSMIARLKAESEAQGRVGQESLLAEKRELEEWREKNGRQMREMEEGLAQAKEENLLLKDAKKLLEAKLSVLEDDHKKQLDDAKTIVHSLTGEKDAAVNRATEMEQNIEKLKELNATLIDKAKILQFELNRQRAQATGMERVCSNFKTQLEDLFHAVEKTKKDNERLIEERSSLKTENSRLAEKDREYQLELQKTKEQVNRFSKIYDNFKTNLKDVSKPEDKQG